jgi:hypothetical protein
MLRAHSQVPKPSRRQQRSERLKCKIKRIAKKMKVVLGKAAPAKAAPSKKISVVKMIWLKTKPGPRGTSNYIQNRIGSSEARRGV